jgi:hypothetical protein
VEHNLSVQRIADDCDFVIATGLGETIGQAWLIFRFFSFEAITEDKRDQLEAQKTLHNPLISSSNSCAKYFQKIWNAFFNVPWWFCKISFIYKNGWLFR